MYPAPQGRRSGSAEDPDLIPDSLLPLELVRKACAEIGVRGVPWKLTGLRHGEANIGISYAMKADREDPPHGSGHELKGQNGTHAQGMI